MKRLRKSEKNKLILICLIAFGLLATFSFHLNLKSPPDDEHSNILQHDKQFNTSNINSQVDQIITLNKPLKLVNSRFSFEITDIIKKSLQLNLTLFVIDPEALIEVIPQSQYKILLAKKTLPNINDFNKQIFTFGVFENDIESVVKLSDTLVKEGYTFKKIVGEDGSKRHLLFDTNIRLNVPVHYLLHNEQNVDKLFIQIVVFYQRNNWFWTGKLDEKLLQEMPRPIHFGQEEGAFDLFNVTKIVKDQVEVFVPHPTDHFLSQISSSHFIECDHQVARWYLETFKSNLTKKNESMIDNKVVNRKLQRVIIRLKSLMKRINTPFWMASGTLLGWYRNCGGIAYTTDSDFGTWSEFVSINFTKYLIENRGQTELTLRLVYGLPQLGYEYRFTDDPEWFWADLFYFYPENKTHVFTTAHYNHWYVKYYYRRFELCSAELLGYKLLVPCDPLNTIILPEYGPGWMLPYESTHLFSPLNHSPWLKWSDKDANRSFINVDNDFPQNRIDKLIKIFFN